MKKDQRLIAFLLILLFTISFLTFYCFKTRKKQISLIPPVQAQDDSWWQQNWAMAGANPQRTSWTSEEVKGRLYPEWYRPIEPYIPAKVQIIAANNLLYVSTASGLYAFRADNGEIAWVYSTQMPLGNSPTIYNGVAYIGGFDHKLYAGRCQNC